MLAEAPAVNQISQVISQATAPAFLLGALAAYTSVLIGRMNRAIDRSQALNAIDIDDPKRARLKGDLPRLKRRCKLLNSAILYSSVSAIFTTLLVVIAFASAFLNVQHERGAGALFSISLIFFAASLVNLARETRIGLHEFDYH